MAVKKPQLPKGLLEYSEDQLAKKLIEWTQMEAKGLQAFIHDLLQTVNIPVVSAAPTEDVEHPPIMKLMDDGGGSRRLYVYYEGAWSYIELVGGGGAPSDDAFGLIAIAGQTTIEADSGHDTLTIVEGQDITLTTDHVTDTLTIAVSAGAMSHTHDDRYYTEGEIDASLALLYTQIEVDTLFTNHGAAADPHTVYVKHALATALEDFIVASGAGVFVKKTLAETGAILEADINHDNLVGFEIGEHFTVASIDHGSIAGLADDDHAMYPLVTDFEADRGAIQTAWQDLTDGGLTALHYHDDESYLDHGGLLGLGDDDHTHYLLIDGTRAMTGNLDMGLMNITNVGQTITLNGTAPKVAYYETDAADPADYWQTIATGGDFCLRFRDDSLAQWNSVLRFQSSGAIEVANSICLLDEDDMASNSANKLATQQSIKAYVDNIASLPSLAHDTLFGLGDDDHTQYMPVDASRDFTSAVTIAHATKNTLLTLSSGDPRCNIIMEDSNSTGASYLTVDADDLYITVDTVSVIRWDEDGLGIDVANSNCVLDEDNMASNDPKRLATQQSIKAYVDNIASLPSLAHDTLFGLGDDDHTQYLLVDGTREMTGTLVAPTGVFNAYVLTDTGYGGAVNVYYTSNVGYVIAYDRDTTLYKPIVVRGTTVKLDANAGLITLTGTGIDGTAIKDEDNMASNSATHLATQQSIKAYCDNGFSTLDHDARHERGGADEIDGDHLDIDYTPTNYAPDTSPAEAAHVDDLTAHLSGIDIAIGAAGGGAGTPTGSILFFGSMTPPSGWLICSGAAVSRATYDDLFAVIGTTFGIGDGSTTFNLPDMLGRVPLGAGSGSGLTARTIADKSGAETFDNYHRHSVDTYHRHQSGNHRHSIPGELTRSTDWDYQTVGKDGYSGYANPWGSYAGATTTYTTYAESATQTIMNPFLAINPIIKT